MTTDFITPFVNLTAVDYLHLDWGDKVMRNTDKSIKDPMEKAKNFYVFNFNIGYGSVALPLNLYVVLVILSDSKLRNDPKYVMKVKTALCSLFIVVPHRCRRSRLLLIVAQWRILPFSHLHYRMAECLLLFNTLIDLIYQLIDISNSKWTLRFVITSSIILHFRLILLGVATRLGLHFRRRSGSLRLSNGSHVNCCSYIWLVLFLSCTILVAWIYYVKARPDNSQLSSSAASLHNSPVAVNAEQINYDTIGSIAEALILMEKKKSARSRTSQFGFSLSSWLWPVFQDLSVSNLTQPIAALVLIASYHNKLNSLLALINPLIVIGRELQLYSTPLIKCFNRLLLCRRQKRQD